jgi:dihydrofolate reductase
MNTRPSLNLIVAYWKQNYGIGFNNTIPWPNITADMRYFKKVTVGGGRNTVIMGKNTALSIPPKYMPLTDRHNIVCSTQWHNNPSSIPKYLKGNIECANTLSGAIEIASKNYCEEIFLIGGQQIYQHGLTLSPCNIYITELDFKYSLEFDTFFPICDLSNYILTQTSRQHTLMIHDTPIEGAITFKKYQKK